MPAFTCKPSLARLVCAILNTLKSIGTHKLSGVELAANAPTAINYLKTASQQHPIIFGKSKDSILVPDYLESATRRITTTNTSGLNQSLNRRQKDWNLDLSADLSSSNQTEKERQPSCLLDANSKSGFFASDADFAPVTTRVLTDENGHSIKIRVASPPPQRQAQLAKLHLIKQQQLVSQQHDDNQQRHQNQRDSVVSLSSDSPLLCDDEQLLCGPRARGAANEQGRAGSGGGCATEANGDLVQVQVDAADSSAATGAERRSDADRRQLRPTMLTYVCRLSRAVGQMQIA